jgi:hypothetical protein
MKKYTFFEFFVIAVFWPVKGPRTHLQGFPHPWYREVPCDSLFFYWDAYRDDLARLMGEHGEAFAHAEFLARRSVIL